MLSCPEHEESRAAANIFIHEEINRKYGTPLARRVYAAEISAFIDWVERFLHHAFEIANGPILIDGWGTSLPLPANAKKKANANPLALELAYPLKPIVKCAYCRRRVVPSPSLFPWGVDLGSESSEHILLPCTAASIYLNKHTRTPNAKWKAWNCVGLCAIGFYLSITAIIGVMMHLSVGAFIILTSLCFTLIITTIVLMCAAFPSYWHCHHCGPKND